MTDRQDGDGLRNALVEARAVLASLDHPMYAGKDGLAIVRRGKTIQKIIDDALDAPPQPAPDAMREALEPFRNETRQGWNHLFGYLDKASVGFSTKWIERLRALQSALSAPDGAGDDGRDTLAARFETSQHCWCLEAGNRAQIIRALRSPLPARAAEPSYIPDDHVELGIGKSAERQKVYVAPPVRPDRETIFLAVLNILEGTLSDGRLSVNLGNRITDAILALPQPTAGEREAVERAISQFEALRNAYRGYLPWGSENPDVKTRLLQIEDMDKAFFRAIRALSRSSSSTRPGSEEVVLHDGKGAAE